MSKEFAVITQVKTETDKISDIKAKTDTISAAPTVTEIADQVWDEAMGHTTAGTAGKLIADIKAKTDLISSSVIKSIQHGTVTVANSQSTGTATITSVDTAKSVVINNGASTNVAATSSGVIIHRLDLTNATTVTATLGFTSSYTSYVSFIVIEFN